MRIPLEIPTPYPGFLIGIVLAVVLGGSASAWLLWRAGLRPTQVLTVVLALTLAVLIGSKLLYLAGLWWAGMLDAASLPGALISKQLRLPGGILLAAAMGPILARALGMGFLWGADVVVPAGGLMIFGVRIGCFLNGCCFGYPSALPWAVSFPRWTEVWLWQVNAKMIDLSSTASLPVQPLQLYFGLAGLLIFAGLVAYRPVKRYDGELLLLFALSYLWSTWLLELLRATPHDFTRRLVFLGAIATTVLAGAIECRLRTRRLVPASSSPGSVSA